MSLIRKLPFLLPSFILFACPAKPVNVAKIPTTLVLTIAPCNASSVCTAPASGASGTNAAATAGQVVEITAHVAFTAPGASGASMPAPTGQLCITVNGPASSGNPAAGNCALAPVSDESWFTPALPAGVDTIAATYAGDVNYAASSSAAATIVVTAAAPPPPAPLVITTTAIPDGQIGAAYSAPVNFTAGAAPYACSMTGAPAGFSITPSVTAPPCTISGTPTAAGTFDITVTVSDSSSPTPQQVTQNIDPTIAPR
jgi:hypothetical protein